MLAIDGSSTRVRSRLSMLMRVAVLSAVNLVATRVAESQCHGPVIPGSGTSYPAGYVSAVGGCTGVPCACQYASGSFDVTWTANASGHAVLEREISPLGFITIQEFECVQGQSYSLTLATSSSGICTPGFCASCAASSVLHNLFVLENTGDCCSSPKTISGVGSFPYDTTGMTTGTEGQNDAPCSFSGQTGIDRDLWVSWVAPSTGQAFLSLCGTIAGNSKAAVRSGWGCNGAVLGCSDDLCGTQAGIAFNVVSGQTYTFQIGNAPGTVGAQGSFGLCVSPSPADCNGNAIPDSCEIALNMTPDCNANGAPDSCDIAGGSADCNLDGIPDSCQPPSLSIVAHPAPATELDAGGTLVLSATVNGFAPILYQWKRNGVPLVDGGPISGSTTNSLHISPLTTSDEGSYVVSASNVCSTLDSNPGAVTVRFGTSFCFGDGLSGSAFSALTPGLFSFVGPQAEVRALAVYDPGDGSGSALIAGGEFTATVVRIARWGGSNWQAIGSSTGANGIVRALDVYDRDGASPTFGPELIAAGSFSSIGSTSALAIARWNGTSWSALGSGLLGGVNALAVFDTDGVGPQPPMLYVGGAGVISGSNVARWDGNAWTAVGAPFTNIPNALAVHDAGAGARLYAGTNTGLFRLEGNTWFQVGTVGSISALASFDSDGTGPLPARLYLGGSFLGASPSSGPTPGRIAYWDGTTFIGLSEVPDQPVSVLRSVPSGSANVLYVGGDFEFVGALASPGIAKWSGTSWSGFGNSLVNFDFSPAKVSAIQSFDPDGAGPSTSLVHMGGRFDRAGGITVRNVTRLELPLGPSCPCGNWGLPGRGCAHSANAGGALLKATGHPSLGGDTVMLTASGVAGPGVFFQGTSQLGSGYGLVYGDGLRCAGGAVVRLGVMFPTLGTMTYPGGSTPSPVHVAGGPLAAGDTRHYQCWFRDAASFCTSATFNLTQGVTFTWLP